MENYDILNILGNSIHSTTYKVRHKETKEVYIFQAVACENSTSTDFELLTEKIKKRQDLIYPNALKFYDHIAEQSKVLYIVTEFCQNGSLKSLIDSCSTNNTYLSEEFICKILYQIALAIKTTEICDKLNTKDIFFDEDYNVKLYNFKICNNLSKEPKMSHLGVVLFEACTLKQFDKYNYENIIAEISGAYSSSLLSLIMCMIKDNSDSKRNINKILCHQTVLLKSSQWAKEICFLKTNERPKAKSNDNNLEDSSAYAAKFEKLRKKEITLQFREEQLKEKERILVTRERKILLMERTVKEKLQQAELYLKRCRETKSVNSGSTKSNSTTEIKPSYENLDSTYVSCGDSIIIPTSTKLNVSKIIKPAPFTRTMSERRIRFKGHSPLKEMDLNRRRNTKQSKSKNESLIKRNSEWLTCSEDTDKSSKEGSTVSLRGKSKQLFPKQSVYECINELKDPHCQPITWTEESKKYAFELLKIMNNDKENQNEIKHTYL